MLRESGGGNKEKKTKVGVFHLWWWYKEEWKKQQQQQENSTKLMALSDKLNTFIYNMFKITHTHTLINLFVVLNS